MSEEAGTAWGAIAILLAALFVGGVLNDPLWAYIGGPLFGLWTGYGLGWLRVRFTAGGSE